MIDRFSQSFLRGLSPICRDFGLFAFIYGLFALSGQAFAAADGVAGPVGAFASASSADIAIGWIDYLFHGSVNTDAVSGNLQPWVAVADGLRRALGLYNLGFLVIGGLLLFYQLVALVAHTAQQGIPFGRRANQVWAPIRLVVAMALLVPVSVGLSAGQYLVVKIAEQGSLLASNAWRMVASTMDEGFFGMAVPRAPNAAAFAGTAIEMELCRSVYEKVYASSVVAAAANETNLRVAGSTVMSNRLPADRFAGETWRYTNTLNLSAPLCGEFVFDGFRQPVLLSTAAMRINGDEFGRTAGRVSSFARTQADNALISAKSVASRLTPGFFGTTMTGGLELRADLSAMTSSVNADLEAQMRLLMADSTKASNRILLKAVDGGWVAAAALLPELTRLQGGYAALADGLLPHVQEPVFAHPMPTQKALEEALGADVLAQPLTSASVNAVAVFYGQTSRLMNKIHGWIYGGQAADNLVLPVSAFDLRDRMSATVAPDSAFALLGHALFTTALDKGIWGGDGATADSGYPFALPSNITNPFTMLAEFGRRQGELGSYLLGVMGTGISFSGSLASALAAGALGLLFLLGGVGVAYAVPFFVFIRFVSAVIAWVLNLFEAVLAMPLVALAHLTPNGEGLSGSAARQAYLLWLGLLIRPFLTLCGFVAGLLIFALALSFSIAALSAMADTALSAAGGLRVTGAVLFLLAFDLLVLFLANAAFKGIYALPEGALRWITPFVAVDGASDEAPAAPAAPAAAAAGTGASAPGGEGGSASASYGAGAWSGTMQALHPLIARFSGAPYDKGRDMGAGQGSKASNQAKSQRMQAALLTGTTARDFVQPPAAAAADAWNRKNLDSKAKAEKGPEKRTDANTPDNARPKEDEKPAKPRPDEEKKPEDREKPTEADESFKPKPESEEKPGYIEFPDDSDK